MKNNKLDIKDKDCNQCELGAFCENKCQVNELDSSKDLMVISSYPNGYNEGKDSVMQGEPYDILDNALTGIIGANLDAIHFTHLVKCNPKDEVPNTTHIHSCLQYLKSEIEFIRPKAIVILGGFSARALFGLDDSDKLESMRKSSFDLEITTKGGEHLCIPTVVTYSPSFIKRSPYHLQYFAQDIYKAHIIATDGKATEVDTKVKIIHTIDEVRQVFEYCQQVELCSWDFETNGVQHKPYGETLFATGLAISFQHGSGYFIPLEQFDSPVPEDLRKEFTLQVLRLFVDMILSRPEINIIGQNLKYDLHVISHYIGWFVLLAEYDDTMYLDHLIDNTVPHGLKEQVTRYYPQYGGYEDAVKKYKWDAIPLEILSKYAVVDSDMTLRLFTRLSAQLMQDERAYKVYKNIIMSSAKDTHKAEFTGLKVNSKHLDLAIIEVDKMIGDVHSKLFKNKELIKFERYSRHLLDRKSEKDLEEKLVKWMENHKAGTKTEEKYRTQIAEIKAGLRTKYKPFNIGSPPQVSNFLYKPEGLGLRMVRNPNTKKMGGSGEPVLKLLNDSSGFIDCLLEYRSLAKTQSTYLVGNKKRLDKNNRIHTSFKIAGTVTGRWSSKDPNVQNVTNEYKQKYVTTKKAAKYIKSMFVPPKGYTFVQVDYSQAELRILAYYAQCKYMLDAYEAGIDLHAQTAADVLGITLDEFYLLPKDEQKLQRYRAKAVNFGFIYGMTADTFKNYAFNDYGLDLTLAECVHIRNTYFEKRPELLVYHVTYKAKAHKFGYVRTLFGSKRILPDLNSEISYKVGGAERQAINTPIQGTCGLLTAFSINILEHRLHHRVKFVNTVHDSIIYYIPNEMLDEQLKIMVQACEDLPLDTYFERSFSEDGKTPVKMKVDIELSTQSWAALKDYKIP